jgi:hypothetical protein
MYNSLQNLSFSIMHRNSYPGVRPIQAGGLQGSLSGPHSSIYINVIPSGEYDFNVAISVCADDTNINVRSGSMDIQVRKLNAAIGLLEPWFRKWTIRINTKQMHNYTFSQTTVPLSPQYASRKHF